MKVFISWSGKRSKALAVALKEWLPLILQYAQPWVSDKDISAGDRWAQAIAGELESSNFGILCITPENLNSQWILFEAGALSKSMLDAKVIPLLFGLELSDLSGPLSQFQALKVEQQGMLEVAKAINAVAENKAADATVEQLVPALWEKLQKQLDSIPNTEVSERHMRPQTEILEDLVSQVRGLGSRMRESDVEIVERELRAVHSYEMHYDVRALEEVFDRLPRSPESDMSLVVLAGFVRNTIPFLADVLLETHRDLKTANRESALDIAKNLIDIVHLIIDVPFVEEKLISKKSRSTFIMEFSKYVELSLQNRLRGAFF